MNFLNEPQLNSFKGVPALPPTSKRSPKSSKIQGSRGAKINEKTMLKRKGKSEGKKRINDWHEPQSARACVVETRFSIFWENLKFHPKCMYLASLFLRFCELFS